MAKKALANLTVGDKHFTRGHVYHDDVVTEEIDISNFETVSDAALESDGVEIKETDDTQAEPGKKAKKSSKKTGAESLE